MRNLDSLLRVAARARRSTAWALVLACTGAAVLAGSTGVTNTAGAAAPAAADNSGLTRLAGHVNGRARLQFDLGRAPDSLAIHGLEVVFAKTPSQQRAIEALIAAQQDAKSPEYHRWLTPAEYGARFGASEATVAAVSRWLTAYGFTVEALPANRSALRFSGTKAQVETAFRTEIHLFDVDGVRHYANVENPSVPAGLAPAITAIHGLHDFYPKANVQRRSTNGIAVKPQITYTQIAGNWVGPGDFAVMYKVGPLYNAGINGKGVTIAIAGESQIDTTVTNTFWNGVGITPPTVTTMSVPAADGGTAVGQTMDNNEEEAYLDIEVAGGVAPGAGIVLIADANAGIAFEYAIQQNIGQVINVSFSACESSIGSDNTSLDQFFAEAATQGQTVVVASDDAGVAGCESTLFTQGTLATTGFAVSGIASSPHALAVGGTDFDPTQPQSWATTNAPGTLVNAQAHIPEMVWNDTCANPIYAKALVTTSIAFCNEAQFNGTANIFLNVAGSGSGVSSCTTFDATSNACTGGYAVPSWQSGVAGIPANLSGRAVPDVSSMAGGWVICSYDNAPCDPTNGNDVDIVGGTSSSTPAVAAIIAMLDQAVGKGSGLVNSTLYQLAAKEYGTPAAPNAGAANCSASLGATIGADCVFYNVTAGGNATPCTVASFNDTGSAPASTCGGAGAGQTNGIMELAGVPQYIAGSGFSLASGLGSINAANLVLAVYLPAPTGLAATTEGQSVQLSWTADPHAASYSVYQATTSGQEGSTPVQTGVTGTSAMVSNLQFAQAYYFTIAAQAALGTSTQSSEAMATIVPAAPTGLTATAGNASAMLTWTASSGATGYNIYQGTSAGSLNGAPVQSGVSGMTATVSGLTNGTTYYFTVAGVDAGGAGPPSNEAQATPVAPAGGGGGGGALGALETALLGLLALFAATSRYRLLRAPQSSERTQRAMSARPMAPECRATSRPPRK